METGPQKDQPLVRLGLCASPPSREGREIRDWVQAHGPGLNQWNCSKAQWKFLVGEHRLGGGVALIPEALCSGPSQILPCVSLHLAGLICILYNKTLVVSLALSSVVCHSFELENLKAVIGILWICSQLVGSMGDLGPHLFLVSEMGQSCALKAVQSDLKSGCLVSELRCSTRDDVRNKIGLSLHPCTAEQRKRWGAWTLEARWLWGQKISWKELEPWRGLWIFIRHGVGEKASEPVLSQPFREGRSPAELNVHSCLLWESVFTGLHFYELIPTSFSNRTHFFHSLVSRSFLCFTHVLSKVPSHSQSLV